MERTEDRTINLKRDEVYSILTTEKQCIDKSEERLRDLRNNNKIANINVMGIPEGEEKEWN